MMLPTHALVGLVAALPLAVAAPGSGEAVLFAGLVGGVLPDADMYVGHRKTLHFPVYGAIAAGGAIAIAALWWTPVAAVAAAFFVGLGLHSLSDVFGGGLELRPWKATSHRAVYDHRRGEWIAPRRWVRYDGAPEDLALSLAVGVPLLVVLDGPLQAIVVASLAVAVVYATVRRSLPTLAEQVFDGLLAAVIPGPLAARLPARYRGSPEAGVGASGRATPNVTDER